MVFADKNVYVDESEMEGFTPPNSPKYCKSWMLSAGLKLLIIVFGFKLWFKTTENKTIFQGNDRYLD